MSGFQTPITIYQALEYVKKRNYLLPAFQREFVWKEYQIENLFDSLMRGYPISSMLFWKVSGNAKNSWKFYRFLDSYVEKYRIHNDVVDTSSSNDFFAVLDGQQRLTSLNIGLYGTYASHEYRKTWDFTPASFPSKKLYLRLKKNDESEENSKIYEFEFRKLWEKDLEEDSQHIKWFRVGKIVDLHLNSDFSLDDFIDENSFQKEEKAILRSLEKVIFTNLSINFYEEDDSSPDKAVNIFTRINAGGTPLTFPMILFSLMVSNWTKDARTEITNLVDVVYQKGFSISTDYVIKAFLFLYHKSVKSQISSFNKEFCRKIENNWENIRDSIYSMFDLLKSFGLDNNTLTSVNATMPILYYIYHKGIFGDIKDSVEYKKDRTIIQKWLYRVLLRRAYGRASDGALMKSRAAFIEEFEKENKYIKDKLALFPADDIVKNLSLGVIDDESVAQILSTQKDNQYCFSILALLYPNLDYKNNNFHKDHLHPAAKYGLLSDSLKEKYSFAVYNSILNLQMLDANENESKNQKDLVEWVNNTTTLDGRKQFLDNHLIPDVDLRLDNFEEFIEERRKLLSEKLKTLL